MFLRENKSALFLSVLAVSLAASSHVFADDRSVQEGLTQAMKEFSQRNADPLSVKGVIDRLEPLEGQADDSDLNYNLLILESRAYYWQGLHSGSQDKKLEYHEKGQAKGEEAKKINDSYAEAYYFAGINLARWGEAKGVVESLFRKQELFDYMNDALSRVTMDGKSGETLDGYGPDRVLGKIYSVLPYLFGGSHKESINHLKKAVDNAKDTALNVVYYAESLNAGSSSEKALAKQLLDEMLSKDPNTYNPNRVPETLEEFALGKKLRSQME